MAKVEITKTELVEAAGAHFDRVVGQILERDFTIKRPPERKVCKECDLRNYCYHEGVIKLRQQELEGI